MTIRKLLVVVCVLWSSLYNSSLVYASEREKGKDDAECYVVTKIKGSIPMDWKYCELRFPNPSNLLNKFNIFDSRDHPIPQPYKIDSTGVKIQDLRLESKWAPADQHPLKYTAHLRGQKKPCEGEKENIFDFFMRERDRLKFGNYLMDITFCDTNEVKINFNPL